MATNSLRLVPLSPSLSPSPFGAPSDTVFLLLVFKLLAFECGINVAIYTLWMRNEAEKEENHDTEVAVLRVFDKPTRQESREPRGDVARRGFRRLMQRMIRVFDLLKDTVMSYSEGQRDRKGMEVMKQKTSSTHDGKKRWWQKALFLSPFLLGALFAGCFLDDGSNLPTCTFDEPLRSDVTILVDGKTLGQDVGLNVYTVFRQTFDGQSSLLKANSSVEEGYTTWTLELKMSDDRMLEMTFSVPEPHVFHVDPGQEIQYQVDESYWNGHYSTNLIIKNLNGDPLFSRRQGRVFHPELRDCKPVKESCGLVSTPQYELPDGQILSVGDTVQTVQDGVLVDFSLCRSYYLEPNYHCYDILEQDRVTLSTPSP